MQFYMSLWSFTECYPEDDPLGSKHVATIKINRVSYVNFILFYLLKKY